MTDRDSSSLTSLAIEFASKRTYNRTFEMAGLSPTGPLAWDGQNDTTRAAVNADVAQTLLDIVAHMYTNSLRAEEAVAGHPKEQRLIDHAQTIRNVFLMILEEASDYIDHRQQKDV